MVLAIPVVAAGAGVEVNFFAPAQATQDLQAAKVDWVLILFSNQTVASGEMTWPNGAEGTNVTLTRARAMYLDDRGIESTVVEVPGEHLYGPIEVAFERPTGNWSSLYVEGIGIDLWVNQTLAQLKVSPSGDCAYDLMTASEFTPQPARTGALCHGADNAALALRPIAGHNSMPFTLTSADLRVIEWHNLRNSCRQIECPADGTRHTEWSNPTSPRVATETRAYERLSGREATLFANGAATAILSGSRTLDVKIDGWLRMPTASGLDTCTTCAHLDQRTLQVEGVVQLSGLRMEPNGTLSANLGGHIQSARLDESQIDPRLLIGAGVTAAAAAAIGLLVLVKLLAGFTRFEPDNAVIHPRRRSIHAYIQSRPGAGFREIMRETKSSSASVRRHLEILKLTGHIVEERHGRSRRFLPAVLQQNAVKTLLMREPPLAQLLALVERNPWLSQGEIMDLAEREFAFSRSTTQHRLGRLLRGGMLQVQRRGRYLLHATTGYPKHADIP